MASTILAQSCTDFVVTPLQPNGYGFFFNNTYTAHFKLELGAKLSLNHPYRIDIALNNQFTSEYSSDHDKYLEMNVFIDLDPTLPQKDLQQKVATAKHSLPFNQTSTGHSSLILHNGFAHNLIDPSTPWNHVSARIRYVTVSFALPPKFKLNNVDKTDPRFTAAIAIYPLMFDGGDNFCPTPLPPTHNFAIDRLQLDSPYIYPHAYDFDTKRHNQQTFSISTTRVKNTHHSKQESATELTIHPNYDVAKDGAIRIDYILYQTHPSTHVFTSNGPSETISDWKIVLNNKETRALQYYTAEGILAAQANNFFTKMFKLGEYINTPFQIISNQHLNFLERPRWELVNAYVMQYNWAKDHETIQKYRQTQNNSDFNKLTVSINVNDILFNTKVITSTFNKMNSTENFISRQTEVEMNDMGEIELNEHLLSVYLCTVLNQDEAVSDFTNVKCYSSRTFDRGFDKSDENSIAATVAAIVIFVSLIVSIVGIINMCKSRNNRLSQQQAQALLQQEEEQRALAIASEQAYEYY